MPKQCNKCNEVKQDNEFYASQFGDGLNWWCNACKKKFGKIDCDPVGSTEIAKAELLKRDIVAVDGGQVSMPYVDLSVWATIPVEAKLSRPRIRGNSTQFCWTFTPKQARNKAGFVFLIAERDDSRECFIVPRDLLKTRDDGSLKSIVVTVGADSWSLIKQFQDRYDYLESPTDYIRTLV